MGKLSRRKDKLRITISTRKKHVSSIRNGISEFLGNPEYSLQYQVLVKNEETRVADGDPIITIIVSALVSGIVGAAAKSFFDWLRSRRGRKRVWTCEIQNARHSTIRSKVRS